MDLRLAALFLGCLRRCHRFADATPSLLELSKLRMGAGQVRQKERQPNGRSRCPPGCNPGDQHFGRVRSLAGKGQYAAMVHHSECLPKWGTFFFGQSDKFLGVRGCRGAIAAEGIWYRGMG